MSVRGSFGGRGRGRRGSNTHSKPAVRGNSKGTNWSTSLPQVLEAELISSGALKPNYASRGRGGRKDRRKSDRDEAKLRKQAWFSKKNQTENSTSTENKRKREPELVYEEPEAQPPIAKKPRQRLEQKPASLPAKVSNTKPKKIDADTQTPLSRLLAKQEEPATRSRKVLKSTSSKSKTEVQEDDEITWLEYSLGLTQGKKSKLGTELQEDGLDDLFADIDRLEASLGAVDASDDEEASSPSSDDEAGSSETYNSEISDFENEFGLEEPSDHDTDEDAIESSNGRRVISNSDAENDSFNEEDGDAWMGIEEDSDHPLESAPSLAILPALPTTEQSVSNLRNVRFDLPDSSPVQREASTSKYVPPHLRETQAPPTSTATSEANPRLNRLLSGHLNKLSPANITVILAQIEALYSQHPRASMTAALTSLIVERVAGSQDILGEINILSFAALTASFYGRGISLRESVITACLERWDKRSDDLGKERNNVVKLWCRLYNLDVIGCHFIYGVIRELIESKGEEAMREEDVEALLIVIKTSGPRLRTDDPSSLKQIVQLVDLKQKNASASTQSSRTRFMVETLNNLKNNRMKTDPGTTGAGSALATEDALRKYLHGVAKKRGDSLPEPLQFNLDDIRQSVTRGKWWQVGAGWSGNPLVEMAASKQLVDVDPKNSNDAKWSKLAKKQGMNTDVRKAIFVALMGAEDYVDACDRILKVGLTEKQQREVVKVILHCCGNEESYNPFYSLVMQRLLMQKASIAHSFSITLQFALWDFFREMGESEVGGQERVTNNSNDNSDHIVDSRRAQNIARSYGWWLGKGNLSLTILKPIPFMTLQPQSKTFLHHMFTTLFLSTQTSSPLLTGRLHRLNKQATEQIFLNAAPIEHLSRGLSYFLETEFGSVAESADDKLAELAEIALDTLTLGSGLTHGVDVY